MNKTSRKSYSNSVTYIQEKQFSLQMRCHPTRIFANRNLILVTMHNVQSLKHGQLYTSAKLNHSALVLNIKTTSKKKIAKR